MHPMQSSISSARPSSTQQKVAARDLLARFPDQPDGWDRLGMAYEARGENQKAADSYRKVIELIRQHQTHTHPATGSLSLQEKGNYVVARQASSVSAGSTAGTGRGDFETLHQHSHHQVSSVKANCAPTQTTRSGDTKRTVGADRSTERTKSCRTR
jgi:hypothetical protein